MKWTAMIRIQGALEEAIDFIDSASDAIGETIDGLEEEELELDRRGRRR